jgi:hypothetical protein
MRDRLRRWLDFKWRGEDPAALREAYRATFNSVHGRLVLQHLLDSVYCTAYQGTDPHAALAHSARRSVIEEILRTLDYAEWPQKYEAQPMKEHDYAG